MKRLATAAALLMAAACSEGGDPVQMALRDASAARHAAAALKETADLPPATAGGKQDAADNGDAAYVASMIEHHRAAVTLAVDALARSDDPEIRRLAQAEIDTRTREITELQSWKPAA